MALPAMKFNLGTVICVSLIFGVTCKADVVFQSALLGQAGVVSPNYSLAYDQFLGVRFHLDTAVHVDSVGGNIYSIRGAPLFAAIVTLSGPTALPSGDPFDSTTIATTTFIAPNPSADILAPLSASLNPGDYGLIFGADQFGASSVGGAMISNNIDIPGMSSYFIWAATPPERHWKNTTLKGLRFVVTGTAVPEPSTTLSLLIGSITLLPRRRSTSRNRS